VARQAHIIVLMVDTAPQVDAHHPKSDEAYGVVSIRLIHRFHRQAALMNLRNPRATFRTVP